MGNDSITEEKKEAQKTSIALFYACVTAFGAAVLWLLSFSSPYWLASWEDTRTDQRFLNMGLWTFCFDKFRFPRNQYDRMYHGCHPIWGYEYREIREWMAPWWLMLIQFFSALAFLLMNIALVVDVALYLRWPLQYVLRFEYNLGIFDFVLKTIVTCLIFFCLAMFGGWCWDREWLLYHDRQRRGRLLHLHGGHGGEGEEGAESDPVNDDVSHGWLWGWIAGQSVHLSWI